MSVSSLLADNSDKSWSNLFINSLTIYNDLTVNGNTNHAGNLVIAGNLDVTQDVEIFGGLTTGANSTFNNDLFILGDLINSSTGSTAAFDTVTVDTEIQFADNGKISIASQDGDDQFIFGNEGHTYAYTSTSTGFATPANVEGSVVFNELGGQVMAQVRFNTTEEPVAGINAVELSIDPPVGLPDRFLPTAEVTCVTFLTQGTDANPLNRPLIPVIMSITTGGEIQFRILSAGDSGAVSGGQFQASTVYSTEGSVAINYISSAINP